MHFIIDKWLFLLWSQTSWRNLLRDNLINIFWEPNFSKLFIVLCYPNRTVIVSGKRCCGKCPFQGRQARRVVGRLLAAGQHPADRQDVEGAPWHRSQREDRLQRTRRREISQVKSVEETENVRLSVYREHSCCTPASKKNPRTLKEWKPALFPTLRNGDTRNCALLKVSSFSRVKM